MSYSARSVLTFCALCLLLTVAGCGPRLGPNISGTLSLDGKPLPDEVMEFRNRQSGIAMYVHTNKDAFYMVPVGGEIGLEPGEYEVAIDAPEEGIEETEPSKIPPKYRDFKTSGLAVTVGKSSQKFDIAMASR